MTRGAGPALVAAHLAAHSGPGEMVGVGRIDRRVPPDADRFARIRADEGREHNERLASAPAIDYMDLYAGNCSVQRTTFERVGGFADDLVRENDFEFGYRLHREGLEFRFLPDGVVTEYRTRGWRQIVADQVLRGEIAVELYRRHPAMIDQMDI